MLEAICQYRVDYLKSKMNYSNSDLEKFEEMKGEVVCAYKKYYLSDAAEDYANETQVNERLSIDFSVLYGLMKTHTLSL